MDRPKSPLSHRQMIAIVGTRSPDYRLSGSGHARWTADSLLRRGLAEVNGDGYRLTAEGIQQRNRLKYGQKAN